MSTLSDRWAASGVQGVCHVNVAVRHGTPGSRALLGELRMSNEEWIEFGRAMQAAGAVVTGLPDEVDGGS